MQQKKNQKLILFIVLDILLLESIHVLIFALPGSPIYQKVVFMIIFHSGAPHKPQVETY
jgi:hypothetical protein